MKTVRKSIVASDPSTLKRKASSSGRSSAGSFRIEFLADDSKTEKRASKHAKPWNESSDRRLSATVEAHNRF